MTFYINFNQVLVSDCIYISVHTMFFYAIEYFLRGSHLLLRFR